MAKGLSEERIRDISKLKGEPEWLLKYRLDAYGKWLKMKPPKWANVTIKDIDFQVCRHPYPCLPHPWPWGRRVGGLTGGSAGRRRDGLRAARAPSGTWTAGSGPALGGHQSREFHRQIRRLAKVSALRGRGCTPPLGSVSARQ